MEFYCCNVFEWLYENGVGLKKIIDKVNRVSWDYCILG